MALPSSAESGGTSTCLASSSMPSRSRSAALDDVIARGGATKAPQIGLGHAAELRVFGLLRHCFNLDNFLQGV